MRTRGRADRGPVGRHGARRRFARVVGVIDPEELAGSRRWAQASLRIATDVLTADAISERLRIAPTISRAAEGEPAFTVWMLESGLDPSAPLEDHLYILVERFRDHRDDLRELCDSATVEVWVSFSSGDGPARTSVLDHGVLAELGDLGIDLVLDPYPSGPRSRRGSAPGDAG